MADSEDRSSEITKRAFALEAPITKVARDPVPLVFERGERCTLWDIDGSAYLDISGSYTATCIGHNHPAIVRVARRQVGLLTHAPSDYLTEPRLDLLEQVHSIAPEGLDRAAFSITGSDANDLALKLARAHSGRPGVISFQGGYHGRGHGALAVSSLRGVKEAVAPPPASVHFAPYPGPGSPYASEADDDGEADARACIAFVRSLLEDPYGGPEPIGTVILEVIQGSAGVVVPPRRFVEEVAALCSSHGIVMIVDEIQTGFGRTGRTWAIEHFGVVPDLLTFGKGIGGGLATSGVLGGSQIMGSLPPGAHTTTFLTNALNLAVAAESVRVLQREGLVERAEQLGALLIERCHDVLGGLPNVGQIRGLGLLVGVELVTEAGEPDSDLASMVVRRARNEGLLLLLCGRHKNVLKLAPPLVIEPDELVGAVDTIRRVLA